MKRLKLLYLLLFLITIYQSGISQSTISFSGRVLSLESGNPVPFHPVDLTADEQIFLNTYMTDQAGFFYDSLSTGGMIFSSLLFSTYDCRFNIVDTLVTNLNQLIYVELLICTDSIPTDCSAYFEYTSNPENPLEVQFFNLSQGNFNQWEWDFGDGNTSQEQDPVHIYSSPAEYNACLTIFSNDSLNYCFDKYCQVMSFDTMNYFNFGGLVYAGEYPLNNPVNAGDTGIARLYHAGPDGIFPVDMQIFQDYGYYWFTNVPEGNYIVKISLTSGSTNFSNYFSTYYGDKVFWDESSVMLLNDSVYFNTNIHLVPVQFMMAGTGLIRGYVQYQGNWMSVPMIDNNTTVVLLNADHLPLRYVYPDSTGYFEFTGLPLTTYIVKADATGWSCQAVTVTLDQGNQLANIENLTVYESNTFGVSEERSQPVSILKIFPNPVIDMLNIEIEVLEDIQVQAVICDVLGRKYLDQKILLEQGKQVIQLPVETLPSGIFLLLIQLDNRLQGISMKFLK